MRNFEEYRRVGGGPTGNGPTGGDHVDDRRTGSGLTEGGRSESKRAEDKLIDDGRASTMYSRYSRASYGATHDREPRHSSSQSKLSADARRYGRESARNYKVRHRQQVRRRRKKIALIAGVSALALVLVGVGAALLYYKIIASNLSAGLDPNLSSVLVETDLANEPFYMLLLGTDTSEEREGDDEWSVDRTDTMVLLRVDAKAQTVTMISLPRDTMVDLGEYGVNKLNAAYAYGGAALAVEAISEIAGVSISHYAEVNFDGLQEIVDALGGIEVDVPIEIDDEDAGGHLDAGLQTLTGEQALILCRSRHAYDDYGSGDLYRAANQRLVLMAIAQKILESDIATIFSTITTISEYVTTDLALMDIIGLAQAMQGIDTSANVYSATMPTTSEYINDLWYEVIIEDEWELMMQRVRAGLAPYEEDIIDEATGTILATSGGTTSEEVTTVTGTVAIRNGNGTAGLASEAEERLAELDCTISSTGNADSFDYEQTLVVYNDEDLADEAQLIVDALGVGVAQLNDGSFLMTDDFLVVIGADWE